MIGRQAEALEGWSSNYPHFRYRETFQNLKYHFIVWGAPRSC